ncbi:MAG: hypothetical protein OXI92_00545, partial [Acidobacteriota bacterium]|nr:hypothetical protein [Acidobacteriota bacterium]
MSHPISMPVALKSLMFRNACSGTRVFTDLNSANALSSTFPDIRKSAPDNRPIWLLVQEVLVLLILCILCIDVNLWSLSMGLVRRGRRLYPTPRFPVSSAGCRFSSR